MCQNPLLIILGPTASGKTNLAVNVANVINTEIISADSRQIFKGMDIGTGKDLIAYQVDGKLIPYHLIDHVDAGQTYNVNSFKEDFYTAYDKIIEKEKLPILCGGTGMYIHSLLQNHQLTAIPINLILRQDLERLSKLQLQERLNGYPIKLRETADYSSVKRLIRAIEIADYRSNNVMLEVARPVIHPLVIGLESEVEIRRKKILDRLDLRLKNGLIEEVETLLANGVSADILIFYGLEYKFVIAYLNNEMNFDTFKERLGIAICQYAKRQMTFFRKMEKDGVKINWLNTNLEDTHLTKQVLDLVQNTFSPKFLH